MLTSSGKAIVDIDSCRLYPEASTRASNHTQALATHWEGEPADSCSVGI